MSFWTILLENNIMEIGKNVKKTTRKPESEFILGLSKLKRANSTNLRSLREFAIMKQRFYKSFIAKMSSHCKKGKNVTQKTIAPKKPFCRFSTIFAATLRYPNISKN